MNTKTLKLKHPVQHGETTITELTFRRPKAKDFRPFPAKPQLGDILDLAGRLCAQPKSVIDELDVEDMTEVNELVGGFMPSGPETGNEQ